MASLVGVGSPGFHIFSSTGVTSLFTFFFISVSDPLLRSPLLCATGILIENLVDATSVLAFTFLWPRQKQLGHLARPMCGYQ
jgi:hypothetical protein